MKKTRLIIIFLFIICETSSRERIHLKMYHQSSYLAYPPGFNGSRFSRFDNDSSNGVPAKFINEKNEDSLLEIQRSPNQNIEILTISHPKTKTILCFLNSQLVFLPINNNFGLNPDSFFFVLPFTTGSGSLVKILTSGFCLDKEPGTDNAVMIKCRLGLFDQIFEVIPSGEPNLNTNLSGKFNQPWVNTSLAATNDFNPMMPQFQSKMNIYKPLECFNFQSDKEISSTMNKQSKTPFNLYNIEPGLVEISRKISNLRDDLTFGDFLHAMSDANLRIATLGHVNDFHSCNSLFSRPNNDKNQSSLKNNGSGISWSNCNFQENNFGQPPNSSFQSSEVPFRQFKDTDNPFDNLLGLLSNPMHLNRIALDPNLADGFNNITNCLTKIVRILNMFEETLR